MAQQLLSVFPSNEDIHQSLKELINGKTVRLPEVGALYRKLQREAGGGEEAAGHAFVACSLALMPWIARTRLAFAGGFCQTILPSVIKQEKEFDLRQTFVEHGLAVLPELARVAPEVAAELEKAVFVMIQNGKTLESVFLAQGRECLGGLAQAAPAVGASLALRLMDAAGRSSDIGEQRAVRHAIFAALPAMAPEFLPLGRVAGRFRRLFAVATGPDDSFIGDVFGVLPDLAAGRPEVAAALVDSGVQFIGSLPGESRPPLAELFTQRARQVRDTLDPGAEEVRALLEDGRLRTELEAQLVKSEASAAPPAAGPEPKKPVRRRRQSPVEPKRQKPVLHHRSKVIVAGQAEANRAFEGVLVPENVPSVLLPHRNARMDFQAAQEDGGPVLSDARWERLRDMLPNPKGESDREKDNRATVEAVLWVARTGRSWRELPKVYGYQPTVYQRYAIWSRGGVWDGVCAALRGMGYSYAPERTGSGKAPAKEAPETPIATPARAGRHRAVS